MCAWGEGRVGGVGRVVVRLPAVSGLCLCWMVYRPGVRLPAVSSLCLCLMGDRPGLFVTVRVQGRWLMVIVSHGWNLSTSNW